MFHYLTRLHGFSVRANLFSFGTMHAEPVGTANVGAPSREIWLPDRQIRTRCQNPRLAAQDEPAGCQKSVCSSRHNRYNWTLNALHTDGPTPSSPSYPNNEPGSRISSERQGGCVVCSHCEARC